MNSHNVIFKCSSLAYSDNIIVSLSHSSLCINYCTTLSISIQTIVFINKYPVLALGAFTLLPVWEWHNHGWKHAPLLHLMIVKLYTQKSRDYWKQDLNKYQIYTYLPPLYTTYTLFYLSFVQSIYKLHMQLRKVGNDHTVAFNIASHER